MKSHVVCPPRPSRHHVVLLSHFGGPSGVTRMTPDAHSLLHEVQDIQEPVLKAFHKTVVPLMYGEKNKFPDEFQQFFHALHEKIINPFAYSKEIIRMARESIGEGIEDGSLNFSPEILKALEEIQIQFFTAIENHERQDIHRVIDPQIKGLLHILHKVRMSMWRESGLHNIVQQDVSLRFNNSSQGQEIVINILGEIYHLLGQRREKYGAFVPL